MYNLNISNINKFSKVKCDIFIDKIWKYNDKYVCKWKVNKNYILIRVYKYILFL